MEDDIKTIDAIFESYQNQEHPEFIGQAYNITSNWTPYFKTFHTFLMEYPDDISVKQHIAQFLHKMYKEFLSEVDSFLTTCIIMATPPRKSGGWWFNKSQKTTSPLSEKLICLQKEVQKRKSISIDTKDSILDQMNKVCPEMFHVECLERFVKILEILRTKRLKVILVCRAQKDCK
jgi:hypothetical protein